MGEYESYRILGLHAGASMEEIKSAYRVLAKRYHPDSSKIDNHIQFDRVTQAYKFLTVRYKEKRLIDFPVRSTQASSGAGRSAFRTAGGTAGAGAPGKGQHSRDRAPGAGRAAKTKSGTTAGANVKSSTRAGKPGTGFGYTPRKRSSGDTRTNDPGSGKQEYNRGKPDGGKSHAKGASRHAEPRHGYAGGADRAGTDDRSGKKKFDDAFAAASKRADIFGLGNLLLTSRSSEMRIFAARRLGRSGKKTAYAFLRKALDDKDETVVRSAVEAIGDLRVFQSAGELSAVFARGGVDVRMEVLHTVRKIGGRASFRSIVQAALQDRNPSIRSEGLTLSSAGYSRD